MNSNIDYDGFTAAIRGILSLEPAYRKKGASLEELIAGEVPRLLGDVERKLCSELRASGVEAEVAAHSALHFVQMIVEHHLADRATA